jgi:hypothetical protein
MKIRLLPTGRIAAALLQIALVWLGLCPSAKAIEPMSDVEKATIIESEGLFSMTLMPGIGFDQRTVFWMDKTRALMRADKVGEWTKKQYEELDKVIVLDIERGKIEETPYRGAVNCYTPERMLLCVDLRYCGWKKGQSDPKAAKTLSGKFGSELEPIGFPEGHFRINSFTCDSFDPTEIGEKLRHGFSAVPMKNGAGYVGISRIGLVPQQELAIFNSKNEMVWHVPVDEKCDGIDVRHTPWDNGYFTGRLFGVTNVNPCSQIRVWKINGYQAQEIALPVLFRDWLNQNISAFEVAWTKRGLLLIARPRAGDWDRLGLYWIDETGAIRRLLKRQRVDWLSVAPDGCHVLLNHFPGFHLSVPQAEKERLQKAYQTSVLNMCKESK